jgi:hypothetical protein
MDPDKLSTIVTLLVALSVASERLVEIIKGYFPSLNLELKDPKQEGRRKANLQFLAVVAGIVTALLARPVLPAGLPGGILPTLALGLLASGGSGFWNSIQSYVLKLKELKKAQAESEKQHALNLARQQ